MLKVARLKIGIKDRLKAAECNVRKPLRLKATQLKEGIKARLEGSQLKVL